MGSTRLIAVSDDRATINVLGRLCRKRGFELVTAEDKAEVRRVLKGAPADLVIVDLDTAEVDGVELLSELAVKRTDGPVLLVSETDARTLDVAQRVGGKRGLVLVETLRKPLDESGCMRAILEALRIDDPAISAANIRQAIEGDELRVHFQPLVDVKTGTVRSVEALLRWQHPEYGDLNPELVVTLAETHGLLGALTQWVTRRALTHLRSWRRAGWGFRVAVNVAAPLLKEPRFAEDVVRLLKQLDAPADGLVLEITESEDLSESVEVLASLARLRLAGIRLAIDDFGTGYSSLGRLHRLPFTELKIDKSFVMDTAGNPRAETVVRAITDLGHNLDLTVVAEGVATRESWDLVAAMGCDLAQGYFISRPLPPEQLTEWLHRWDVPQGVAPRLPVRSEDAAGPAPKKPRAASPSKAAGRGRKTAGDRPRSRKG